ncbi:MAG: DUF1294 domain-containing protein [Lachnospiraceae bacterium]|nr:DUF1294 domain-containing protein [Lachnospiraceae bacterium]
MTDELKYYLVYLAAMCALCFILYGIDKSRAKKSKYRIPEAVLLFAALAGGAAGAFAGMKAFRHKTRKWYFILVNILGLAANAAMIFLVMQRF